MRSYCVHNYLNGNCEVAGTDCAPASVEQRVARIEAMATARL